MTPENAHTAGIPMPLRLVDDFQAELAKAIQFVESLGVRTKSTRFDTYRQIFGACVDQEFLDSLGERERMALQICLSNAAFETAELLDIVKLPRVHFEGDREAMRKLQKVFGGRAFRIDYKDASVADPNRDAAFELATAGTLERFGLFGGFSRTGGDVVVLHRGVYRPVECKRLSSPSGISEQVRNGRRRLERRERGIHGLPDGVLAIDVTRAINPHLQPTFAKTSDELKASAGAQLKQFIRVNQFAIQQHGGRPGTLGVMVRLMGSGFVGSLGNIHRHWEWTFVHLHGPGTNEAEAFADIAEQFGPGRLEEVRTHDVDFFPEHLS